MKIYDTSLFYRYATWLRSSDTPPPTSGCDLLFDAATNTFILAFGTLVALLLGAKTLACLDVTEPKSELLAVAMAIGTGYLIYLGIYALIRIIKPLCEKVEVE